MDNQPPYVAREPCNYEPRVQDLEEKCALVFGSTPVDTRLALALHNDAQGYYLFLEKQIADMNRGDSNDGKRALRALATRVVAVMRQLHPIAFGD